MRFSSRGLKDHVHIRILDAGPKDQDKEFPETRVLRICRVLYTIFIIYHVRILVFTWSGRVLTLMWSFGALSSMWPSWAKHEVAGSLPGSKWPRTRGYCVSILGYCMVYWPNILGCLAFQTNVIRSHIPKIPMVSHTSSMFQGVKWLFRGCCSLQAAYGTGVADYLDAVDSLLGPMRSD